MEMSISEMKQHIKSAYPELSFMLWGQPGIGKTHAIKQVAEELAKTHQREFVFFNELTSEEKKKVIDNPEKYFILSVISLSSCDITDLKGYPKFDEEYKSMIWYPPLPLKPFLSKNTMGILFLDEFNNAHQSIQKIAYMLLTDKMIDEHPLSKDTMIVMAGNRQEDNCFVFPISWAVQTRIQQIHVKATPEEWINWALSNNINKDIILFIQAHPDRLNSFDANQKEGEGQGTSRTWTYASILWNKGLSFEGLVGTSNWALFNQFLQIKNKLDFKEILDKPEIIKNYKEIDERCAIISMVVDWTIEKFEREKKKDEKKKVIMKMFEIADNLNIEEATLLIKSITRRNKECLVSMMQYPEIIEQISKYSDMIVCP